MEFHKTEKPLRGEITIPGDKSISHRSVMFGAISQGTTEITNFLQGQDCLSTISCFRKMGIEIENTSERILVHGRGLHDHRYTSQPFHRLQFPYDCSFFCHLSGSKRQHNCYNGTECFRNRRHSQCHCKKKCICNSSAFQYLQDKKYRT